MTRSTPNRCSELIGALVVAGLLAAGPAAWAQPDASAYQEATAHGYELFDQGDYAGARAEFEKAYQIQPKPLLLFNIASTYRREGNAKVSLAYYSKFLDVAPRDHPQRRQAEEAIEILREKIALEEQQAETERPSETGPPLADEPPVEAAPRGRALMWSGVAVGVVGLGGLSWGLYQGKVAMDRNDELEALQPGAEWNAQRQELYDEGESAEVQSIIFSIAGGVAVATGATLFVIGLRRGAEPAPSGERALTFMPYAGDSEAGVTVVGSF